MCMCVTLLRSECDIHRLNHPHPNKNMEKSASQSIHGLHVAPKCHLPWMFAQWRLLTVEIPQRVSNSPELIHKEHVRQVYYVQVALLQMFISCLNCTEVANFSHDRGFHLIANCGNFRSHAAFQLTFSVQCIH